MTPDELWDKYSYDTDGYDGGIMPKRRFLAALHEYGALVRARDAEIARSHANTAYALAEQGMLTDDVHGALTSIAAAISREPLP